MSDGRAAAAALPSPPLAALVLAVLLLSALSRPAVAAETRPGHGTHAAGSAAHAQDLAGGAATAVAMLTAARPSDLPGWAEYSLRMDLLVVAIGEAKLKLVRADQHCAKAADPDGPVDESCVRELTPYGETLRTAGLHEACPATMAARDRIYCLSFVAIPLQQAILGFANPYPRVLTELRSAFERRGRPAAREWRSIPEARRLAAVDAVYRLAWFAHTAAMLEVARQEHLIFVGARPGLVFNGGDRGWLEQQERRALQAVEMTTQWPVLGGGEFGEQLAHWLDWSRRGVPPPAAPAAVPAEDRADARERHEQAQAIVRSHRMDQAVTTWFRQLPRPQQPTIWVKGGKPIFLPDGEAAPDGGPAATPSPTVAAPGAPPPPVEPPAAAGGPTTGGGTAGRPPAGPGATEAAAAADRSVVAVKLAEWGYAFSLLRDHIASKDWMDLATWRRVKDYESTLTKGLGVTTKAIAAARIKQAADEKDLVGLGTLAAGAAVPKRLLPAVTLLGVMSDASGTTDRVKSDFRNMLARNCADLMSPFPRGGVSVTEPPWFCR